MCVSPESTESTDNTLALLGYKTQVARGSVWIGSQSILMLKYL